MCGIVGYTGKNQSAPILLNGLAKLEYRGYDSAGIAVRDGDSPVQVVKAKGRLKVLAEKTNDGQSVIGTCGIGHTRWATHGEPSETNAHPHISNDYNVVGVHNGIIENYQELRDKLQEMVTAFILQLIQRWQLSLVIIITRSMSIRQLMQLIMLWCVSVVHTHLQLCLRNIRKRYMLHVRTVL